MSTLWGREPSLILAVVQAMIALLVAFWQPPTQWREIV